MSHTVTYYRWSDKKPDHGQDIWYVYHSQFYGSVEVLFGKAEWQWEQIDETGLKTGSSCAYNEEDSNDPEVEGYMLTVFISGFHRDLENVKWCPADAFDHMFD